MGRTAADKIWDAHVVQAGDSGSDLIYIDLHLLMDTNTAQAFAELRATGRTVRRPELTLATEDHIVPTGAFALQEPPDEKLIHLRRNCRDFGIDLFRLGDPGRGITHVIAPETGLSQPGMTVICCDSHTTTHGAFGALAFGVGTSQVEHVLVTQTLRMRRMKNMRITVDGVLGPGVTAKDLALAVIERIGTGGGQGHVIEYDGPGVRGLSMEGRMTLCNMSIEAGARAALVTPDEVTFAYLRERKYVPTGPDFDREVAHWSNFVSDPDAIFDKEVRVDASAVSPRVSWGTNPAQSVPLDGVVPAPTEFADADERRAAEQALAYMDLEPGTPLKSVPIQVAFIGSCTNGRIEDLRAAAQVWKGRRVDPDVRVHLVPGSEAVRRQAVDEGLDAIFAAAGVELRLSGCSMCIGILDKVEPGLRSASTTNRNFEGRQGSGARTHLVSPSVAAASAVLGRLAEPSDLNGV